MKRTSRHTQTFKFAPTPYKPLRAAVLAGVCCGVLATRVYVAFDPIRIKAVEAPVAASGGVVRVRVIDQRVNALLLPFAVIARIRLIRQHSNIS